MSASNPLDAEVQRLEPDALVELFELDLGPLGGDVLYYHAHQHAGVIRWQAQTYNAWPIRVTGFARTGDASQPAPTITVSNVTGLVSRLCRQHADLLGAQVRRRRTLARYLDGAPQADPSAQMPVELWCIEQKTCESAQVVEFALSSALDLAGHQLPARQILAAVCQWKYKAPECGYKGTLYYTRDNQQTDDSAQDQCAHRLSSCRLRHPASKPGQPPELPFGGFPGASGSSVVLTHL
ncbi:phage minor tail protein L [Paraburkholderia sp. Tr-20389]|uniref:phage minor tail protein L n=1 Tax=Paraburkholderia sp. Tr-20389 TaxID=2703903 RepID=UPI0019812FF9|nr:phage minor tail protein L [Paraburkholderia sp. Tr-20389]MBN3758155.1 phage minor tail protein L [Paraburkholderia sp. Tr-20389]